MKRLDTGLSGCKLELIEPDILRKYSSSKDYNLRLNLQINKQKLFSNQIFKNIQAPKVLNVHQEDLYFFDMEYVSGYSFFEYFSVSNLNDINFVLTSLFSYFDFLIETKKEYKSKVSREKILKKIKSLYDITSHKQDLLFIEDLVVKNELNIPQTFCHGDLTFTNIIFHPSRLYFIDFLDCFIDTFLSDLVKLKQDLYYGWSLNIQKIESLRVKTIYSYLWKKIENRYSEYIHTLEFEVLDVLNTLRLDPYLTDPSQRIIITKMLKNSSLYENFNCSYGGTFE
jgi:hypothetical protein